MNNLGLKMLKKLKITINSFSFKWKVYQKGRKVRALIMIKIF